MGVFVIALQEIDGNYCYYAKKSEGKFLQTVELSKAKAYKTKDNAVKIARRACKVFGFRRQLKVLEWKPEYGMFPKVVQVI